MSRGFISDSIEQIQSKDNSFSYYKVNNFRKKTSDNLQNLKGHYFIMATDQYLWHFLSEHLTQYELLKKEIPDLKIIVAIDTEYMPISENELPLLEYIEKLKKLDRLKILSYFPDICRIYLGEEINDAKIYNLSNLKLSLEHMYFIYDWKKLITYIDFGKNNLEEPYFYKKTLTKYGMRIFAHQPWSTYDNKYCLWERDGMRLIRKRMRNLLTKNDSLPKKIYIDRTDANLKWGSHSLKESKNLNDKDYVPSRYYRREHLVRNYFENIGYTSLSLGDYEYIDQLNFFYNATHIVGLCGSGLLNAYVSEKDTNLTEIYVNKSYDWSYSYVSEISPINVFTIDLRHPDQEEAPINTQSYNLLNMYKEAGYL